MSCVLTTAGSESMKPVQVSKGSARAIPVIAIKPNAATPRDATQPASAESVAASAESAAASAESAAASAASAAASTAASV